MIDLSAAREVLGVEAVASVIVETTFRTLLSSESLGESEL